MRADAQPLSRSITTAAPNTRSRVGVRRTFGSGSGVSPRCDKDIQDALSFCFMCCSFRWIGFDESRRDGLRADCLSRLWNAQPACFGEAGFIHDRHWANEAGAYGQLTAMRETGSLRSLRVVPLAIG